MLSVCCVRLTVLIYRKHMFLTTVTDSTHISCCINKFIKVVSFVLIKFTVGFLLESVFRFNQIYVYCCFNYNLIRTHFFLMNEVGRFMNKRLEPDYILSSTFIILPHFRSFTILTAYNVFSPMLVSIFTLFWTKFVQNVGQNRQVFCRFFDTKYWIGYFSISTM